MDLPETKGGHRYILTIVDHFSRFVRLVMLKEANQYTIARALFERWIVDFGVPGLLVYDSGSQFRSKLFK